MQEWDENRLNWCDLQLVTLNIQNIVFVRTVQLDAVKESGSIVGLPDGSRWRADANATEIIMSAVEKEGLV